jgi:hypothetical protein
MNKNEKHNKAHKSELNKNEKGERGKEKVVSDIVWKAIYDITQSGNVKDSTSLSSSSSYETLKKYFLHPSHRDTVYRKLLLRVPPNERSIFVETELLLHRVLSILKSNLPLYHPSPQTLQEIEVFCASHLQNIHNSDSPLWKTSNYVRGMSLMLMKKNYPYFYTSNYSAIPSLTSSGSYNNFSVPPLLSNNSAGSIPTLKSAASAPALTTSSPSTAPSPRAAAPKKDKTHEGRTFPFYLSTQIDCILRQGSREELFSTATGTEKDAQKE